jgi:hypothetical protein
VSAPPTARARRRAPRPRSRLAWLWLVLCCASCSTCGDQIAELESLHGPVQRDHGSERGVFVTAQVGDLFVLGDGLRTGAGGHARLAIGPDGVALVQPNTLLRFLADEPGQRPERIALEEGAVAIEHAPLDLEVHTPRAIARLSERGKVLISTRPGGEERFDVLVGRVAISHEGQERELSTGQSLALPPPAGDVAAPAPRVEPLPPPAAAPEPAAEAAAAPAASSRTDLPLPDEDAVLHVPTPPARVRVALPACEEAPRVEVGSGRRLSTLRGAPGSTQLAIALDVGQQRVRVRCGDSVSRDVLLRVQRDPATQELPRSAQRVEVEADGRKYTVHYQNVLPAVTFVWPGAPAGEGYALVLQRGARSQRYPAPAPRLALRPGELSEGELRYWFEDAAGARSRESSLRIVFDNTARSAYLSEPRMGEPVLGPSVQVAGAALAKSEVSVAGQPLPLDAQGRFRGEVPVGADDESIAVRVRHPLAGVHYYLRRIR